MPVSIQKWKVFQRLAAQVPDPSKPTLCCMTMQHRVVLVHRRQAHAADPTQHRHHLSKSLRIVMTTQAIFPSPVAHLPNMFGWTGCDSPLSLPFFLFLLALPLPPFSHPSVAFLRRRQAHTADPTQNRLHAFKLFRIVRETLASNQLSLTSLLRMKNYGQCSCHKAHVL